MKPSSSQAHIGEFQFGFKWSFLIHLVLFALVAVKTVFFPGGHLPYIPTLKVDLVGLPELVKKDLKNPGSQAQLNQEISKVLKQAEESAKRIAKAAAQETTPKETAKEKEMVLHPKTTATTQKRNKRALERLKSLAKLQASTPAPTVASVILGNKVSPGSSLSGEAKEAAHNNYLDDLRNRLQENWVLPPWISRQNLSAQIQLYLDARGSVKTFKFLVSSGNTQFDDAVKRAIHDSQPFPKPPEELSSTLLAHGILIGFPL